MGEWGEYKVGVCVHSNSIIYNSHRGSAWLGYLSVGGVTVSIVAFQAVDPGSTPGQRIIFHFILDETTMAVQTYFSHNYEKECVGRESNPDLLLGRQQC